MRCFRSAGLVVAVARIDGTPRTAWQVELEVSARPNSVAGLWLGADLGHQNLPIFPTAPLRCVPIVVSPPLPIPSSGLLELPVWIPSNIPLDLPMHSQFFVLEPGTGDLWSTNSLFLLVEP